MPRTKLGASVQKTKDAYKRRADSRAAKAIAQCPDLTYKDYRELCDILFETWIRFRDGWKCVLCGKQYEIGDWCHYVGAHFISRRILATRYLPYNCHGQSNWLNHQQRLGNPEIQAKYLDFMRETYGQDTVNELFRLSKVHTVWNLDQWRAKTKELYEQMLSIHDGQNIIEQRLNIIYNTRIRQYQLNRMLREIQ